MILITGGAGFIGSHLVDYLMSNFPNHHVIVVDNLHTGVLSNLSKWIENKKFEFYEMDVTENMISWCNSKFDKIDFI